MEVGMMGGASQDGMVYQLPGSLAEISAAQPPTEDAKGGYVETKGKSDYMSKGSKGSKGMNRLPKAPRLVSSARGWGCSPACTNRQG